MLNKCLAASAGFLILAHRGTVSGLVVENTPQAVIAALRSGADAVEIDVIRSADGEFFAFHDGAEQRLLGTDLDLRSCPAEEIRALRYIHADREASTARVATLEEILRALPPSGVVNLDRSWDWWTEMLPYLDRQNVTDHVLLKCSAHDNRALSVLADHPEPYQLMPICRSVADLHRVLAIPQINTVAVELIADSPEHELADPTFIAELRDRGLIVTANAEMLTDGIPLFAGYDDETSLFVDPEEGWGHLVDLGITMIQTDWPWLLADYRRRRLERAA
ncbi:glycerophosphodiester phosphodiesterase family protein [Nesterenkonia massiliensis]|uniref:glycerophosphodiester phosphodiesterase family protein n=1 Tax=Nesterenkonia massiliensis TaxID=1232429 RepID=UPI000425E82B|nr:glycerophosphodiester phosphodiesterase family protein [Nesterenkonia massiliensis]